MGYEKCKSMHPDGVFEWEPKLCHDTDSTDCGCCTCDESTRPPSPPPSVTSPCKPSHECKQRNGFCTTMHRCKHAHPDGNFIAKPLCNGSPDCICCIGTESTASPTQQTRSPTKQTRSPTNAPVEKPCWQSKRCSNKGGKCMSRSSCSLLSNRVVPGWCKGTSCVCCIPKTVSVSTDASIVVSSITAPCKQSRVCARKGGTCSSKAQCEEKGSEYKWLSRYCSGRKQGCGCCLKQNTAPPTVSSPCIPTSRCSRVSGRCMTRKMCRSLGKGYRFNKRWCSGKTSDCGCCWAR
jgi:hypothetical protein